MTDNKQRTCGDCAWFQQRNQGYCDYPASLTGLGNCFVKPHQDAAKCSTFRSHADQAIIDECHRRRSLGAAVEWSKIDRLVEIAAGRELEGRKRCEWCEGQGDYGVYVDLHGDRVDCPECHCTGYQKGGE